MRGQITSFSKRTALSLSALVVLLAISLTVERAAVRASAQDLIVQADFASKMTIAPNEPIEFKFNRVLAKSEGTPAVILKSSAGVQHDLSGLFSVTERSLKYDAVALPLPVGEATIIVYLISPTGDWRELAQFPLRVAVAEPAQASLGPPPNGTMPSNTVAPTQPGTQPAAKKYGFDKFDSVPSLNLGLKSQFAEAHFPNSNRPQRLRFTDVTLQAGWRSEMQRGTFSLKNNFDVIGSSFQNEALRFGLLGAQAPYVDLSNYQMQFQFGASKLAVGHLSYGAQRHLIRDFSSRGFTFNLPITKQLDLTLAALSSSSMVGWSNFLGVQEGRHRMLSGTLGYEFSAKRPGALRLEVGVLDAWFKPRTSFNQATITDAERSRGWTTRILTKNKSQRLRLEAGFTRSFFVNVEDPLLVQNAKVAPPRETTRNARFADLSIGLLKNFSFVAAKPQAEQSAPGKQLNLTLNYRHERVDPLYRSIGATNTPPDKNNNQAELVGSFGELSFNLSHTDFYDNLRGIRSILRTLSKRDAASVNLPLAMWFKATDEKKQHLLAWLPRVGYRFDRFRAAAAFAPIGGGFDNPSTLPNQANINQTFTAEWQFEKVRVTYQFNRSLQDNRQIGRALADLRNRINVLNVGWMVSPVLDLSFELNNENVLNGESRRTDRTLRYGFNANWRATTRQTFNLTFTTIGAGDLARTSRSRNIDFDTQWSYRLSRENENRFKKVQTNLFVRYANRYLHSRDSVFGLDNLTKLQTFNTGLNFIFF
jgi:hypothetical protein